MTSRIVDMTEVQIPEEGVVRLVNGKAMIPSYSNELVKLESGKAIEYTFLELSQLSRCRNRYYSAGCYLRKELGMRLKVHAIRERPGKRGEYRLWVWPEWE